MMLVTLISQSLLLHTLLTPVPCHQVIISNPFPSYRVTLSYCIPLLIPALGRFLAVSTTFPVLRTAFCTQAGLGVSPLSSSGGLLFCPRPDR